MGMNRTQNAVEILVAMPFNNTHILILSYTENILNKNSLHNFLNVNTYEKINE